MAQAQQTARQEQVHALVRLLVPDWRPTAPQVLWAIRIVIVLGILVTIGYSYGITFWNWIELLIVPAVIAGGGIWFNQQQHVRDRQFQNRQKEREQAIAEQRAEDEALQAYLEQMSKLLVDKDRLLSRAQPGDNSSVIARAWTLTVLGRLDADRKRSILQFLYEAGLINRDSPRISLGGADLSGISWEHVSLRGASLAGANLGGTRLQGDLSEAEFVDADLTDADLLGSRLLQADLTRAKLQGAHLSDLTGACLRYADLREAHLWTAVGADMRDANLSKAHLVGAHLSDADLSGAKLHSTSLRGADLTALCSEVGPSCFVGHRCFFRRAAQEDKGGRKVHRSQAQSRLVQRHCNPL